MKHKMKKLKKGINKSFGRNNRGIITSKHREGGHKRLYRFVQFTRNTKDVIQNQGEVQDIQYDPNRSAAIALVKTNTNTSIFILHPVGLQVGDTVIASENAPNTVGNAMPLRKIPLGFTVHNVELHPGKGGQLVRSAGTGAQVTAKEGKYVTLRLPSGEVRLVLNTCWASIGQLGNTNHGVTKAMKAGKMRWLGRRPHVRGVAKNAVDHPHGGGEGRSSIGKSKPLTPWGKPTLGVKTRDGKKYSNKYIIRSR
jgi:large subunit ribosomal protein L2